ncbi:AIPR family protein [Dermacoccus sp. GAS27A]|uniref:AIPR family protein n=1 Tax=Dermacoccus sp. GAS27A TaxID=3156270 RepID=UPI0038341FA7
MVAVPFNGYYGWVTGATLADLFNDHGERLFSKNLRSGLGGTEINADIAETALRDPEKFWYYNNGVTFVSNGVARTLRGGAAAENVALTISNGSIVNGAQTTSTLGGLLSVEGGADALSRLKCLVRVLEIPDDEAEFAVNVTRFNNSQNGIGAKDFVSLDPFQQELRRGLDRDFAVSYVIRSGEDYAEASVPTISLQDATVALVSCGVSVDNAVRAKDKISSLWRDTRTEPYISIFDQARVTPLALYKAVEATRYVESFLLSRVQSREDAVPSTADRERAIAIHGNRLFTYYVLTGTNIWREEQSLAQFMEKVKAFELSGPFVDFVETVFDRYGTSYKAPLFKNRTKCSDIISALPRVDLGIG